MRNRMPAGSIRWRILASFLVIISVIFALTSTRLTEYVSGFLYEQRIRQDSLSVERLADTAAPLFASADEEGLRESLLRAGGELGGRLLVLDRDGKVQFDTWARLMGTRLVTGEVQRVLSGGETVSYGIHHTADEGWVAYCAAALTGGGGALLYVRDVAEMMASLDGVRRDLTAVFSLAAIAAVAAALIFSHVLTRPINRLTQTIRRMGEGDLSVRVPVKGSGEMRRLAESYNTMAAQLEALDRSRNQFVSDASHELKTPLTAMKSLLEDVLYQPSMPEETRTEFLSDVDREIDRLTGIINDLLTLTRMDNGRLEIHAEPLSLSEGVQETLHMLRPQAEKRGQKLLADIDEDIRIQGDPNKLSQVFWNLIENAIKYTPDGGTIEVRLRRRGNEAIFTVRDNGVGIPEEDLPHVFERFYRVDKARSRETGGTGLGLAIVKQLVNLHGGEVKVASVHGEGSVFTVILPAEAEG